MMRPTLSVIIPTFKALPVLTRCVDSWRRYAANQPVELVVIEDGGRDASREYLAELQKTPWAQDRLQVLHADDVHELVCTNRGFEVARGALLLAWQSDMFLTSRWLVPELLRTFKALTPLVRFLNTAIRDGNV